MGWLSFKAQYAIAIGHMEISPKHLVADDCPYSFNATSHIEPQSSSEEIFPLYEVSYMWYTFLAAMVTVIVTLICSLFFFGWNDPKKVSPELITPVVRRKIFENESEGKIDVPRKDNEDTRL